MTTTHNIKIGQHYRFDYAFAGSNYLPDYNSRHGKACLVLSPHVENDEYDPESQPMLNVRFLDGFEGVAWDDELIDIQSEA